MHISKSQLYVKYRQAFGKAIDFIKTYIDPNKWYSIKIMLYIPFSITFLNIKKYSKTV